MSEASPPVTEARAEPKDIGRICEGQKAVLRFSQHEATRLAEADREVVLVASDRVDDTLMSPGYDIAHIRTDGGVAEMPGMLALRPGVPVEVFIVTITRSAWSDLLWTLVDNVTRSLRQH